MVHTRGCMPPMRMQMCLRIRTQIRRYMAVHGCQLTVYRLQETACECTGDLHAAETRRTGDLHAAETRGTGAATDGLRRAWQQFACSTCHGRVECTLNNRGERCGRRQSRRRATRREQAIEQLKREDGKLAL